MSERDLASAVVAEVKKVIVGKDAVLVKVLAAILAGGHILLEDIPGVGKTTMALAFAKALGLRFNRVQFTPDVMPSDITGYSVYQKETGTMVYQPGAVLTNVFLADELNRATSRTQSALLEAMEEGQVTVDGQTHLLPQPFLVIATQNPLETLGTFPLPEAQMDRFLMRLSMEELSPEKETELIRRFIREEPLEELGAVCEKSVLSELQKACRDVYVHKELMEYLVSVVQATRKHAKIENGVSPRGTLAYLRASQAYAMVQGSDYVVPEDLKAVAAPVLAHRISLQSGISDSRTARQVISDILQQVPVPTEDWRRNGL